MTFFNTICCLPFADLIYILSNLILWCRNRNPFHEAFPMLDEIAADFVRFGWLVGAAPAHFSFSLFTSMAPFTLQNFKMRFWRSSGYFRKSNFFATKKSCTERVLCLIPSYLVKDSRYIAPGVYFCVLLMLFDLSNTSQPILHQAIRLFRFSCLFSFRVIWPWVLFHSHVLCLY